MIKRTAINHLLLVTSTLLLLVGCSEQREERRNYSLSNPKERTALTDSQLVDRLKSYKPDHYDDLFDDANDRLISAVTQTFPEAPSDAAICFVAVRRNSDPRRHLGQEIIIYRGNQYVARVLAIAVVPDGLACRLMNASDGNGAMPIQIGDSAQSSP